MVSAAWDTCGGLLPLIGLGMCASTGNIYAGLYYPIAVAALTLIFGMVLLKETHGTLIWEEATAKPVLLPLVEAPAEA